MLASAFPSDRRVRDLCAVLIEPFSVSALKRNMCLTRVQSSQHVGRASARAIFCLGLLPSCIWSNTIASQGPPNPAAPPGLLVSDAEALEVSWTSTNSYDYVSVSVSLGQVSAPAVTGTAYLTTQIGAGTTAASEVGRANFTFPNPTGGTVQLFNNLSLGPGTYFLVLYSTSAIGGGWSVASPPTQITDNGVTIGGSGYFYDPGYAAVFGPFPYAPVVPFSPLFSPEALVFSVDGSPTSPGNVPEPSCIYLTGFAVAIGALWRLLRASILSAF